MSVFWGYARKLMDDDVVGMSAELAYRFMFATFPFAIFLVALSGFMAGWLGIGDPSNRIINTIGSDLPKDLVGPVKTQLEAALAHTQPGLLSIGALITLYAAAAGTSSIMKAMNRAYGVPESRPLVLRVILAGVLTVLGGLAIVISFGAIVGVTLMTRRVVDHAGLHEIWPLLALMRWPTSLVLLVLAVAALLRYAPALRTPWRWALLSAAAFAIVWIVATYAFGVYVARFASYDATYGALAGVIVLMLWFYLSSLVLLCAAELAALLVRIGSPELLPGPD